MDDLGREVQTFRIDALRLYRALIVLGSIVGTGVIWLIVVSKPDPNIPATICLAMLLLGGVGAWLEVARTAVRVRENGIEVQGLCGTRAARWSQIRYVRFFQHMGPPYLKLEIPDAKPLFVPVYLKRWPDFVRMLMECAGAEHDITA